MFEKFKNSIDMHLLAVIFAFVFLLDLSHCNEDDRPAISELVASSKLVENKKFHLNCHVNSERSPITSFEWLLNGQRVVPNENVLIDQVRDSLFLTIKSMNSSYNGEYSCLIKSAFGEDSKSMQVRLNGGCLDLISWSI